jgi:hypothetical protein
MILIFLSGIVQDFLVTLSYKALQHDKDLFASVLTFFLIFLSYYVFYNILSGDNIITDILIYALGNAIGCYLATKTFKKIKK